MVDRTAKREEFRAAVRSMDAFQLAKVLTLPPLPRSQSSHEPQFGKAESLQVSGTDWGIVVTAWLDALEAAEKVRFSHSNVQLSSSCIASTRTESERLTGLRCQVLRSPGSYPYVVQPAFCLVSGQRFGPSIANGVQNDAPISNCC